MNDDFYINSENYFGTKTVSLAAFDLPCSSFLGPVSRTALERYSKDECDRIEKIEAFGNSILNASADEIQSLRQYESESYYASRNYANLMRRYPVSINTEMIGDIYTEVFTPNEGVSSCNQERVLINLHGGSFIVGARSQSHLESIPIAAVGKFKVISVDYRMGPEHQFPAASNDVIDVYKALLQVYKPENIGIYGCSAGALLTAQSIAFMQKKELSLPGAIGMLCGGANYWFDGDSGSFIQGFPGYEIEDVTLNAYLKTVDVESPLVFPGKSAEVLARFPPSLLISSSRDCALSSVVHTHSQLIKCGVQANLHVWEGLLHAYLYNADLPESHESYDVIVNFFDKYLGQ